VFGTVRRYKKLIQLSLEEIGYTLTQKIIEESTSDSNKHKEEDKTTSPVEQSVKHTTEGQMAAFKGPTH